MNIIKSFVHNTGEFTFIRQSADCSKKIFYRITQNHIYTNQILIQITRVKNEFDEHFDEDYTDLSQYDCFKYMFTLLNNTIGNVPKIIEYDDNFGLILMEYVGEVQLKEYILNNENEKENIYVKLIDWLLKLNKITTNTNLRNYGQLSIKKEIDEFMDWVCSSMTQLDKFNFMNELIVSIRNIGKIKTGLCHRDFQVRNVMCSNNDLYIIDVQDMCSGPYIYDLACLLYDSNIVMDDTLRIKLAKYYYDNSENSIGFDEFYEQLKLLGIFRIFKSYGRQMKYFIRDTRWQSLELIQNNKKLLDKEFNGNPLLQFLDKYKLNVVILAAGKGTRMESDIPKTLCLFNRKPMLFNILDNVVKLNPYKIVIVVGHQKEMVIDKLNEYPYKNIEFIEQTEQLGTGHATKQTKELLSQNNRNTLVLFGDKPCMTHVLLKSLVTAHCKNNCDGTLVTYKDVKSHTKAGRVIRNKNKITEIYEDQNENFPSDEFSGGIHIFKSEPMFYALDNITVNNKQNEYYLCDIVKIIVNNGGNIGNILSDNTLELSNINTQADLKSFYGPIRIPENHDVIMY